MSRSGYSDDCDNLQLWRQAVDNATFGQRGQAFLKKLRDALDAMPTKRLITDAIRNEAGEVCALGAVDPTVTAYEAEELAKHFGIARALAAEIVYVNDERTAWYRADNETPEERWTRMRAWVAQQIGQDDAQPPSVDAVDPIAAS